MIGRGANINPKVFAMLVQTAKDLEIPYQIEAFGGGTGTDANAMQISRAGMATGLISVPAALHAHALRSDVPRRY